MYSQRTGESLDTIYFVDGQYVPEALNEISYFMRDWRQNKMMKYDAHNVDNLAATLAADGHRRALPDDLRLPHAADQPRCSRAPPATPTTSARWPPTSGCKSRSVKQISGAAFACNGGGVGIYNRSNFVHMDCGPVRSWHG